MGPSAYLGDRSHFYINIPGREAPVAVAAQNMERLTAPVGGTDQPIWMTWTQEAVVLLPRD
jgi:spermidine/putrescine transport system ATP-binding protein/putrescine transport system ATP-binding protein